MLLTRSVESDAIDFAKYSLAKGADSVSMRAAAAASDKIEQLADVGRFEIEQIFDIAAVANWAVLALRSTKLN